MSLGNIFIPLDHKIPINILLDYIIDEFQWDVENKLFNVVKYIIEETDGNDWKERLNVYFKSKEVE